MKTQSEISEARNLMVQRLASDGGCGEILFPRWRGSIIWSTGGGWDHVSVAPYKKSYTPTWEEMCRIKDMFFNEDEAVVQYHPAKSEYVNNVTNCLHLWRPQRETLPLPPSIMVGIKKGMTAAEAVKAIDKILDEEGEHETG